MLVAAILIPLLALGLLGLINLMVPAAERGRMLVLILAGYVARLLLFLFVMRSVAFFSHGVAGGDCLHYQDLGSMVALIWRVTNVHFVTAAELPNIGDVALLVNLLAMLEYVGGETAPLAGTAINAFVACWTVLIFYRFVVDNGTAKRSAGIASAMLLFGPSFLYYTSDTYKDGLNAFLVLSSLLGSIRLSQRFEWWRVGALCASLAGLWFIRHYMVFMCLLPLVVGVLGTGEASATRRVISFFLVVGLAAGASMSGALGTVVGSASQTFARATSENSMSWNTIGGSGVVTDSYAVRLVYTLFAPFPWQGGSFGLQLGKIEAFLFYYFMWRTFRGRNLLAREHRSTVIMLLIFIVPATLAYAATMSNVGLIVRQRMPIVMCIAILGTLTMSEAQLQLKMPRARPPEPPPRLAPRRPATSSARGVHAEPAALGATVAALPEHSHTRFR